jgi:GT2 family glycosyltransferase
MTIAVVILNWNGANLLAEFLPSVVTFSKEATIYVADNASTDSSLDFLSRNFPNVKIIKNTENGGYAKGYNEALTALTEDIYVLLNSDVAVTKDWLQPILSQFKSNPNLVAAQPKILDYKNKNTFEYAGAAGGFIDTYGYPFCRGRIFNSIEKDEGQYNDIVPIFWATGACLCITKKAFQSEKGFDQALFAHQEEIDLCWRLQKKRGEINYIGTSTVYHLGGGTLSSSKPQKTYLNFRNSLLIMLKNIDGISVFRILFIRMILDGIAAYRFLFKGEFGHFAAIFKAHVMFYKLAPSFYKKRSNAAGKFQYAKTGSIVWQHFVKKRTIFKELETVKD